MKKLLIPLFILVFVLTCRLDLQAENITRIKTNINREWKFKLGDYSGAESESYSDKDWSNINLPHNFSIPYFQSAQWYTGFGWYRKYFTVPAQWNSKRVFVEFEGAFREAQIFVNGKQIGTHRGGYTGFSIDTRASSEALGKAANRANDKDKLTLWESSANDNVKWWQVDFENLYTVSAVNLLFPSGDLGAYKIELSKDNQNWETIAVQKEGIQNEKSQRLQTDSKIVGRYLRITFTSTTNKPASINEFEVFGKTVVNR